MRGARFSSVKDKYIHFVDVRCGYRVIRYFRYFATITAYQKRQYPQIQTLTSLIFIQFLVKC